jgi:hypothetical protein
VEVRRAEDQSAKLTADKKSSEAEAKRRGMRDEKKINKRDLCKMSIFV